MTSSVRASASRATKGCIADKWFRFVRDWAIEGAKDTLSSGWAYDLAMHTHLLIRANIAHLGLEVQIICSLSSSIRFRPGRSIASKRFLCPGRPFVFAIV